MLFEPKLPLFFFGALSVILTVVGARLLRLLLNPPDNGNIFFPSWTFLRGALLRLAFFLCPPPFPNTVSSLGSQEGRFPPPATRPESDMLLFPSPFHSTP